MGKTNNKLNLVASKIMGFHLIEVGAFKWYQNKDHQFRVTEEFGGPDEPIWNPSENLSQATLLPKRLDLYFKMACWYEDGKHYVHLTLDDDLGMQVGAVVENGHNTLEKAMALAITRACILVWELRQNV